ncbi:MAG: hypothetical protein KF773_00360 [Deltaproteobacteria bacterium]|nr:hypothetical protein [Deltaproteobacteria bacterium]
MFTCSHCGGLTPHDASSICLHCDVPLPRRSRWARRLSVLLLGPAGAILLAACYGAGGRYNNYPRTSADAPVRQDKDGDGALGPWTCLHNVALATCEAQLPQMPVPTDLDCDDNDPTRYPGAEDIEGDGIDQNCDGVDGWRDPNTAADPAHVTVPPPAP